MKPLVTIIVPVHNGGAFLPNAVTSVIGQSFRSVELIVVDDGSTDDTAEIAGECAREDGRIRVLALGENRGAGPARNAALDEAGGSHVMFLDADDELDPLACEILLEQSRRTGSDIVCGRMKWRDRFGAAFPVRHLGMPDVGAAVNLRDLPEFPVRSPVVTAKLFTARLIRENRLRFSDVRHAGDSPFALASWHKARVVTAVPYPVYYRSRRMQPGSLSLSEERGEKRTQDRIDVLLLLEDYCSAHDLAETAESFRRAILFNLYRTALAISAVPERAAALSRVRVLLAELSRRGLEVEACLPLPLAELDAIDPAIHDDLWFEYRVMIARLKQAAGAASLVPP
jgi:CDP-glycerol glycerophosphotransferase